MNFNFNIDAAVEELLAQPGLFTKKGIMLYVMRTRKVILPTAEEKSEFSKEIGKAIERLLKEGKAEKIYINRKVYYKKK
jgi:hypothetical protein